MTEEPAAGGRAGRDTRHYVYALWIEETTTGEPLGAIETVRLPIEEDVLWLEGIELVQRAGRSYVNVRGYRRSRWTELMFELGPPGQVTRVAAP